MNRILTMVVSAIVVIAGLAVICVPMTMTFSENIHSVTENTGPTYNLVENADNVELSIENGIGYVNGERIKESNYNGTMLMFGDSFIISYNSGNEGTIENFFIVTDRGTSNTIIDFTASNGVYSATTASNTTMTDTYDFILSYDSNGNYMRAYFSGSEEYYVNADSKIFIGWTSAANNSGLYEGTIDSQTAIFNNGDETGGYTITKTQHTTSPDVWKITGMTSQYSLFIPVEYDMLDGYDNMLRLIVSISPVLIGLFFFISIGMGMVAMTRK